MSEWIRAQSVRVDGPNGVLVEGVDFASDGPHLAVVGGPSAFGAALAGLAPTARGALTIDGEDARSAMLGRKVAFAPLDPRAPPDWTARDWVEWSARLAGLSRHDAREAAARWLAKLSLAPQADHKLAALPLGARRAATIAGALATGARSLVFADPTTGMPDDTSRALARALAEALDEVRWVLIAGRIGIASPLGLRTDDAVVLSAKGVVAQGSLAEVSSRDRVYTLRVAGPASALADLVRGKGAVATPGERALTVELTEEMTTHDLFVLAAEASVTIVSLRPVAAGIA